MFTETSELDIFKDCKSEQEFKMKFIKSTLHKPYTKVFCIETEETVKGFPDVMQLVKDSNGKFTNCFFYEFKFTKTGKIKFQPTQISFFRQNKDMEIDVVAYDKAREATFIFPVGLLFEEGVYKVNERAEVDLRRAYEGTCN
jgi:hypothetical protein